jgi:hypothetical protein
LIAQAFKIGDLLPENLEAIEDEENAYTMCEVCGFNRYCAWNGNLWICISECGNPYPESDDFEDDEFDDFCYWGSDDD